MSFVFCRFSTRTDIWLGYGFLMVYTYKFIQIHEMVVWSFGPGGWEFYPGRHFCWTIKNHLMFKFYSPKLAALKKIQDTEKTHHSLSSIIHYHPSSIIHHHPSSTSWDSRTCRFDLGSTGGLRSISDVTVPMEVSLQQNPSKSTGINGKFHEFFHGVDTPGSSNFQFDGWVTCLRVSMVLRPRLDGTFKVFLGGLQRWKRMMANSPRYSCGQTLVFQVNLPRHGPRQ